MEMAQELNNVVVIDKKKALKAYKNFKEVRIISRNMSISVLNEFNF